VTTAANGQQALTCVIAERPDIVLTDLHMPVMSGIELCAGVLTQIPALPVILMSEDPALPRIAAGQHVAATLAKPLEPRTLLATPAQLVPCGAQLRTP
jgi:two-component system, NtrC family, response regulator GlrR